ncbi:MAG: AMP-binding protein, partial [Acidimicrobiia bacterium]|nr:AMP-binding protein [Acidimicrobiia bacterium]
MSELAHRAVPADLAAEYQARGWWTDHSLGSLLARGLADAPASAFRVYSSAHPWSGTTGQVADGARRLAGGLRARGIGAGDLVAFQLPNWAEAAMTLWAVTLLGAVPVPIVHFYGPKEVGFILAQSGARALVTADRFGHLDFLDTIESLWPGLPALETVAVVAAGPDDMPLPPSALPFAALLDSGPVPEPAAVDPAGPALVAYTSGTTADPKGVVHTHRSIGFEIRQLAALQPAGALPSLVGAPVGHGIGMLAALLLPVQRREPIHLIDLWDPARVLAVMAEDRLSSGTGATFFLTSLLDHPDFTDEHRRLMPFIGLGGAAVPATVADRADALGISLVRLYGSTEHPSVTGSVHGDPRPARLYTDGAALKGVELRLDDEAGRPVGAGQPGEIVTRGPDCCLGYTAAGLTAAAFDANGWFTTGDVGVLDEGGRLRIVDRKKDIIIRGGENISAL